MKNPITNPIVRAVLDAPKQLTVADGPMYSPVGGQVQQHLDDQYRNTERQDKLSFQGLVRLQKDLSSLIATKFSGEQSESLAFDKLAEQALETGNAKIFGRVRVSQILVDADSEPELVMITKNQLAQMAKEAMGLGNNNNYLWAQYHLAQIALYEGHILDATERLNEIEMIQGAIGSADTELMQSVDLMRSQLEGRVQQQMSASTPKKPSQTVTFLNQNRYQALQMGRPSEFFDYSLSLMDYCLSNDDIDQAKSVASELNAYLIEASNDRELKYEGHYKIGKLFRKVDPQLALSQFELALDNLNFMGINAYQNRISDAEAKENVKMIVFLFQSLVKLSQQCGEQAKSTQYRLQWQQIYKTNRGHPVFDQVISELKERSGQASQRNSSNPYDAGQNTDPVGDFLEDSVVAIEEGVKSVLGALKNIFGR